MDTFMFIASMMSQAFNPETISRCSEICTVVSLKNTTEQKLEIHLIGDAWMCLMFFH